jgi:hypothetical protein
VHLPWQHSARTSRYGVLTCGLLTGASLLVAVLRTYPWDRHLLPHIAVDDVVYDLALVLVASLWFRLSWILVPEQPNVSWRSAIDEVFAASEWAFWLTAVVVAPLWVIIIIFFEHDVITQFAAAVNIELDVLFAAYIVFLVWLQVAVIGSVMCLGAVTLRQHLHRRTHPHRASTLRL